MKTKKSQKKRLVGKAKRINLPIHYTPVSLIFGMLLIIFLFWHPKQAVLGITTSPTHKVCTFPVVFFGIHLCLRNSDMGINSTAGVSSEQSTPGTITIAPTTTPPTVSTTISAVDLTKLPLGDIKITTTTPQKGYLYLCHTQSGGGGSSADGPWIHGTTWNYTAKLQVSGSIAWKNAYVTVTSNGTNRVIKGNGLPVGSNTGTFPIPSTDAVYAYDFNPNSISAQTLSYTVLANPTSGATPTCTGGMVGVALNGVTIFNGVDGENRDAVAHEAQDQCDGHPEKNGTYHYHDLSRCIKDEGSGHSNLVGYAFDGFGMYGMRGENGETLTNNDLDMCHGHTHTLMWDGQKVVMYHYHATYEFPYTVGCFRGTSSVSTPQQAIQQVIPSALPSMHSQGQRMHPPPMMTGTPPYRLPPPRGNF